MDPTQKHRNVLNKIEEFFDDRASEFGATHQAADYNSIESQEIRFQQLIKVIDTSHPFSVLDYGCGYGPLAHFLLKEGYQFTYQGFDIAKEMIDKAIETKPKDVDWSFTTDLNDITPADYTIACAIFNIKLEADEKDWKDFILDTLINMADLSTKGFAFNLLTKYSDKEYMRSDLYYADPLFLFDYCKMNFSRNVALLHDYELYDFTILVRL